MQIINGIYQGIDSYRKDIPSNTLQASAYAFGGGLVFKIVLTGNVNEGIKQASTCGLATIIYGLMTPLFKKIINKPVLTQPEELSRTFTAIIAAKCAVASYLGLNINHQMEELFFLIFFYGVGFQGTCLETTRPIYFM